MYNSNRDGLHNFIPSRLLDSRARTGTLYFLLRRLPVR